MKFICIDYALQVASARRVPHMDPAAIPVELRHYLVRTTRLPKPDLFAIGQPMWSEQRLLTISIEHLVPERSPVSQSILGKQKGTS